YGWMGWKGIRNNRPLTISYLRPVHYLWTTMISILLFAIMVTFLSVTWESISPNLDAMIVSLSIVAQFLLCRKIIECWILWFIIDLAIACLHFEKALLFHSAQHIIYLALAISGYMNWYKIYKSNFQQRLAFS